MNEVVDNIDIQDKYIISQNNFKNLTLIISAIRNLRSELNIPYKDSIKLRKLDDEGKIIDIPTKNIDLNIPSIPACLQLHNIDVIVRLRTLKDKAKS